MESIFQIFKFFIIFRINKPRYGSNHSEYSPVISFSSRTIKVENQSGDFTQCRTEPQIS